MPNMVNLSWETITQDVNELCETFVKRKPDVIVGIGRGGLIPAVMMSYKLQVKDMVNFSVRNYNGFEQTGIKVIQQLDDEFILKYFDKNILIVDSLSDSGTTLEFISQFMTDRTIYPIIATLYIKENTNFSPDAYIRKYAQEDWLVFPWE